MSITDVGLMRYYDQLEFANGVWHDYSSTIECKASDPTQNCDICLVWRTLQDSETYPHFNMAMTWKYMSNTSSAWETWRSPWVDVAPFDAELECNPVHFNGRVGMFYSTRILHYLNRTIGHYNHETGTADESDPIYSMIHGKFQNRSYDAVMLALHIRARDASGNYLSPLTAVQMLIHFSPTYTLTNISYSDPKTLAVSYTAPGWKRFDDVYRLIYLNKYLENTRINGTIKKISDGNGIIYIPLAEIPEAPSINASSQIKVQFNPVWDQSITNYANDTTKSLTLSMEPVNTPHIQTSFTSNGFLRVTVSNNNDNDITPTSYAIKLECDGSYLPDDTQILQGSSGYVDFKYPPTGVDVKVRAIAFAEDDGTLCGSETVITKSLYKNSYYIISPVADPTIKVYARYNYKYSESYDIDTVEVKFNDRKFASVFFGDGANNSISINFEIPNDDIGDGMPKPIEQLSLLKRAAYLGECILCDTLGNRKKIAITSMNPSYEYNSCKWTVSLDITEVD